MKIYLFFYIGDKDEIIMDLHDYNNKINNKGILYAVTNKKEYAEAFKNSRNMEKFIIKTSYIEKNKWKEISKKYYENILDFEPLTTHNENSLVKADVIDVMVTQYEKNVINDYEFEFIFSGDFFDQMPHIKIFNKKIRSALENLKFDVLYYSYAYTSTSRYIDENEKKEFEDFLTNHNSNFIQELDQLNLLINTFQGTFT